jgi:alpha-beta hydrolase superfamily lysophospholipase
MTGSAASRAEYLGDLRAAFQRLASSLPAFTPRRCPPDAREYLDFYGLDMALEYPQPDFGLGAVVSGDHRLALHCWEPPGATETLVLVHGYFDHVGLYSHLVRFGLSRGANVVAFDLPGHGISSGPRGEIRDFAEYRQAIADVLTAVDYLPGKRLVIAQSTGGAATMDYLQNGGASRVDRVVLLAPLVRPTQWRRIVFTHRLLSRFVDQVPRRFADSSQDPQFLNFLREDPLQSLVIPVCWVAALRRWLPRFLAGPVSPHELMVVQGDADDTVDWTYNLRQIRRLFPAMRLYMVPGGRHHLANERADLRTAYFSAIESYLEGHAADGPGTVGGAVE